MCGRAIRCITNVFYEAVCGVIINFCCYRPIYACVDIIFNQCIRSWNENNNQNAAPPINVIIPAVVVDQHAPEDVFIMGNNNHIGDDIV
jgi:hypothetical protein